MKNEISVKRDSSQLGRLNKVFHVLSFELFPSTEPIVDYPRVSVC
jgi:hypothetical protein